MTHHLRHGLVHARKLLHQTYHGGRKFLQHVDIYANMAKRILAASQPMLQDLGVQNEVMGPAMRGFAKYDQAKADVMHINQKGEDHYSRIAAAIN